MVQCEGIVSLAMPCFFLSVLNNSQSDQMTAIFVSHMIHNTSVRNGGRCLAYNASKYEQNWFRFKEIMAAEIRVSSPKDWILLCRLKVNIFCRKTVRSFCILPAFFGKNRPFFMYITFETSTLTFSLTYNVVSFEQPGQKVL